jgi:hypothetical protein
MSSAYRTAPIFHIDLLLNPSLGALSPEAREPSCNTVGGMLKECELADRHKPESMSRGKPRSGFDSIT